MKKKKKNYKLKLLLDNNKSDVGDIISIYESINYNCSQSVIFRDFNNKKVLGPWCKTI